MTTQRVYIDSVLVNEIANNINAITVQVATLNFGDMWNQIEDCLTSDYFTNKMALRMATLVNNSGSDLYGLIIEAWFPEDGHALAIDADGNVLHAEVERDLAQMLDIWAQEEAFPHIHMFYDGTDEAKTWGVVWDDVRQLPFFRDCEGIYQVSKDHFGIANERVLITDNTTALALSVLI